MRYLLYHFISGEAFFSGVALLVLAVGASALQSWKPARFAMRLLAAVGLIFIVLSATPFPLWVYCCWFGLVVGWLVLEEVFAKQRRWAFTACRIAVVLACLAAAIGELPYHMFPSVPPRGSRTIYVIGDSISAGIGQEGGNTWPNLLRQRLSADVVDLSRAGATINGAIERAEKVPAGPRLVLVEIGGNDMFAHVPAEQFERSLSELSAHLQGPQSMTIMFELPLPPFSNRYGRAQRMVAKRHDVILVPKRLFAKVLMGRDSTLDSIHLSVKGHEEMAEVVSAILKKSAEARE